MQSCQYNPATSDEPKQDSKHTLNRIWGEARTRARRGRERGPLGRPPLPHNGIRPCMWTQVSYADDIICCENKVQTVVEVFPFSIGSSSQSFWAKVLRNSRGTSPCSGIFGTPGADMWSPGMSLGRIPRSAQAFNVKDRGSRGMWA